MGHYPWLRIADYAVIAGTNDLLALFTEAERQHLPLPEQEEEDTDWWFGYRSTPRALRDRLQAQGMTADQARYDLEQELARWSQPDPGPPDGWTGPIPSAEDVLEKITESIALPYDPLEALMDDGMLDTVFIRMSERTVLRLLVDRAPETAVVDLDLSQLTGGCCFPYDMDKARAADARADQLTAGRQLSPLLVLTEGATDARLLTKAMRVTHPHLSGFVSFLDFDLPASGRPEGGASALAKTATTFIAAGVVNRFIAMADNDLPAHQALAKLKAKGVPGHCRILHYPPLPLLAEYPTLPPGASAPVLADVNGSAGTLELYLGRDVLTGPDGQLVPLLLNAAGAGGFPSKDKKAMQDKFERKCDAALAAPPGTDPEGDWSAVSAIIDMILHAFDAPSA
ncbi:hypothetical protein QMA61_36630 [Streptomyces coelicoflavus]|uniref:hypothetical protein n=1 Tax=Streptomyces coelicoflavus TaxID=285562 RepID=UPI0024ACCA4D|nr:hypothetical protein [Streptomyces coelicoflavus]MDI6521704.1 hypothetical protein [Streptomyces coelicoflavus]